MKWMQKGNLWRKAGSEDPVWSISVPPPHCLTLFLTASHFFALPPTFSHFFSLPHIFSHCLTFFRTASHFFSLPHTPSHVLEYALYRYFHIKNDLETPQKIFSLIHKSLRWRALNLLLLKILILLCRRLNFLSIVARLLIPANFLFWLLVQ